ncbi:putative periplasmic serine endoprotease DegP-like [Nymphon striatum]|nr:putative periplasmic serine endoprotease DegP-like [Nymphon striatum]
MRKIWLIFAQAVTVCMAILFVLQTFKPELLDANYSPVVIKEAAPQQPSSHLADTYSGAAKKAMPAVVNIFTSSKNAANPHQQFMDDPLFKHFFGDQEEDDVATADAIEIAIADGRKLPAEIVGSDPESDLALLKIEAENLPSITFASPETLDVGDIVLAIGNPFGVGQTITQGIVSALGRNHLGINTYENFIQTDASINPGNSGGALINTAGDLGRQVMEQIAKEGSVTRGWVGVEAQNLTPELAESFSLPTPSGALIADVLPNSPAANAGLKAGDILLAINGKPVVNSAAMLNLIAVLEASEKCNTQNRPC